MNHLETFLRAAWMQAEQNAELPCVLESSVEIVDDKVMLHLAYGELSHTFTIRHNMASMEKTK